MVSQDQKQGQVRIIGGQWRSRRVNFTEGVGLRPTPDRVRETLFNWLNSYVEGAVVLDLYAGSGALFLEALSRGAKKAVALDTNRQVISTLKQHVQVFKAEPLASLVFQDAMQFLRMPASTIFDVVFVDPPFHQQLLQDSCQLLEENNWLAPSAWIYTECERGYTPVVPATWRLHRDKIAGQVHYRLWHRAL